MNSALGFGQEAEFSIDKSVHKFPKTEEGKLLSHTFVITNTGDVPLIISDYKVACTCTKAILPKEPIKPGEQFDLIVTFNTNGKYYFQERTIQLFTNAKKKVHDLTIKVKVIPTE